MTDNNSRLTKLEVSVDFFKDLITEIRSDIKDAPTRAEYDNLQEKLERVEKSQNSLIIKTGIASGFLGLLASAALKMIV